MNVQILGKLGLTNSEIRVYLKLLELGSSKTGVLTSRAKVSRSKIYEILEKLMQKGLASYVIKENTKYFEAADPNNLEEYIKKKKKELEETSKELHTILPSLKQLQKLKKEKQTATIFEGYKGIRTVFNDILNSLKKNDEYYAFALAQPSYTKEFSAFIMNYHKRREVKGIKVKLLSQIKLKKRVLAELDRYKHIEFRFTNETSPTATIVFNSKVFIFTWKTPTAILIQSKEIAQQYKDHFLDIWKRAL